MKSATDKIQLFKPDSIARKIGGDTEDVLAVMKACFYKAANNAMEWALRGDHTKPWPLETAENRGDALVDHLTAAYCASLHAVTVGKEDIGHVSKEVHLRDIRAVLVKPCGFERRQFWREEIARWLQAMELGSEYAFAADSETPPINGALKRAALVSKLSGQWPTIDRDLRDASENGLKDAARTDRHGFWHETKALAWAQQRGKVIDSTNLRAPTNSVFSQQGKVHRIKG